MQATPALPPEATPAGATIPATRVFERSSSAMLVVVLTFAVLFCFALPFATVSCDSVITERMTGIDLVRGTEPETILRASESSNGRERDREDVREAVKELRSAVRLEFVLSVLVVVVAVFAGLSPAAGPIHRLVLLLALIAALSFVAGLTAGSEALGPTVHHLYGFWSAAALSVSALLAAFIHGRLSVEAPPPGPKLTRFNWAVIPAGVVALMGAVSTDNPVSAIFAVLLVVLVAAGFVAGLVSLIRFRPTFAALLTTTAGGVPIALLAGMGF